MSNVSKKEETFYDETPSMFRNKPFWFGLYVVAIIAGVWGLSQWSSENDSNMWKSAYIVSMVVGSLGFMSLLAWWLRVVNIRLAITNERVTLRTGILSKNIREVYITDIRSMQIDQRFMQRILNTCHVEICSAATSESEIRIDGIPYPDKVKKLIDEYRRD